MTGGQIMVVLIVTIVMIATVLKNRHGYGRSRSRSRGSSGEDAVDAQDAERLRREVAELKDRLAVLERITVEKESSLERQIEQLRDR